MQQLVRELATAEDADLQSPSPIWTSPQASSGALVAPRQDFPATLLAMAGHDLRQPLQIITSAHDVLAATLDERERREELTRAAAATSRLATMLGQIVEAVQLHELRWNRQCELVCLQALLDDLAREFSWAAHAKGISLRIGRSRAVVESHPVLLGGILRNLVRNAIEYTPSGGRVVVACRRDGAALRIEVRDSGIGICAGALSRIIEAFERANETRVGGLGLGLFIVKRAADLLGHRVEVRSAEGAGWRFALWCQVSRNFGSKRRRSLHGVATKA